MCGAQGLHWLRQINCAAWIGVFDSSTGVLPTRWEGSLAAD
jgi:hypothetical protein